MLPRVSVQEMQATAVNVVNELPGRTTAYRVAEVRPQVNGIVEKRLFTEGSEVEAGEQLYQIDDATYQAAHKKAMANLRTAELQARRYAELSKVNAVSRQAHDDAQAAHQQAQAEVEMTQSAVEMLGLRKALEEGRIQRDAQGEAPVTLRLEDGSMYEHEGGLQFSEVEVSPGTGSVTIRAQFPNPDRLLLPGMFVHAQVDSGQLGGVYLLPNEALTLGNERSTVYVVDADNRIEARQVVNERMLGKQWLITEGLQDGDRVVIEGRQKVRPGAQVEVVAQPATDVAAPAETE